MERENKIERVCMRVCVCVCVCEREREREREMMMMMINLSASTETESAHMTDMNSLKGWMVWAILQ